MLKRRRAAALLAAAALTGCANIDAGDIQAFGTATTAVAQAARDARGIDNTLARAIRTEEQATVFAMGGGGYEFPPAYRATLVTGDVWDVRIAYAAALADYGQALARAASGVEGPGVAAAVDNMQKVISTAAPNVTAVKTFEPAAAAISGIVQKAITEAAWRRIQTQMRRAHPTIVKGQELLAADFALVADRVQQHYGDWLLRKRKALDTIRRNGSASEKITAYKASLDEQQAMANAIRLLVPSGNGKPGYAGVLDNMVSAHKQLAEGNADPAALADFVAAAKQLAVFARLFASTGG
ncbi:hypothetical protein SB748_15305 [Rhizobium sp. SIMBA_035]